MSLPDVSVTIRDGALGLVAPNSNGVQVVVGVSSQGDTTAVHQYSDMASLVSDFGVGPMVEAAAQVLAVAGGPVAVFRIAPTTPGSNGSVTAGSGNTGTTVMTVTGTPNDQYLVLVKCITGAVITSGNAQVQVSFDNGLTYGPLLNVSTGGAVSNLTNGNNAATGLSLAFTTAASANMAAGDTYSFSSTAGTFANSDLATAMTALLADPTTWFMAHIVGIASSSANAASFASTVDTALSSAATNSFRYAMALIDLPQDTDANLKTAFASFSSKRVGYCAGFVNVTSPITGSRYLRPGSWALATRLSAIPPQEDAGRVATGPLLGVTAISRDEFKTPGLDSFGFSTLRTIVGLPGFYITNPRLPSGVTSDFQFIQYRRVMDIGASAARTALLTILNSQVRVDPTTGYILEQDAQSIEAYVLGQLSTQLVQPGYCQTVSNTVKRNINVLATQSIYDTIRVLPFAYAKYITEDIGFTNPGLALS